MNKMVPDWLVIFGTLVATAGGFWLVSENRVRFQASIGRKIRDLRDKQRTRYQAYERLCVMAEHAEVSPWDYLADLIAEAWVDSDENEEGFGEKLRAQLDYVPHLGRAASNPNIYQSIFFSHDDKQQNDMREED